MGVCGLCVKFLGAFLWQSIISARQARRKRAQSLFRIAASTSPTSRKPPMPRCAAPAAWDNRRLATAHRHSHRPEAADATSPHGCQTIQALLKPDPRPSRKGRAQSRLISYRRRSPCFLTGGIIRFLLSSTKHLPPGTSHSLFIRVLFVSARKTAAISPGARSRVDSPSQS